LLRNNTKLQLTKNQHHVQKYQNFTIYTAQQSMCKTVQHTNTKQYYTEVILSPNTGHDGLLII